jgi:type III pantothenate kinase
MLLIDAGNSRIKWAWVEGEAWLQQGVVEHAQATALRQQFAALPVPDRILVSNVAGEAVAQQIRTACGDWRQPAEFIAAQAQQCGVRNGYQRPAQLGSDRWAALIAAWQQTHAACLVVHCGTATTVDALTSDGEFCGGLILPGISLMQHSLAAAAAGLTADAGGWQEFPRNTADAMASGAIAATCGAIRRQHELLGAPAARCLLGGGAAGLVAPHLQLPLEMVDNLVLRGLQIIGQETDR